MRHSLPISAEVKNHMLNNKAGIVGIVLGICLIAVSLFAYSQVSALQSNVNSKQADNDNLHSQVTDLQQQVADMQSQLNDKTSDLSNAQGQITSLNDQIADLHSTITIQEQLLTEYELESYLSLTLAHSLPDYLPAMQPQSY